ncbi:MAG: GNAT family N-acetyltransferase, partial [Solirubrobacteraceae bacterium]
THRRRGLMRRMLESSLGAAQERGDAVSILIAAEWPIYGRFGYAPATLSADYTLRSSRPGASCPGEPARVRAVRPEELGTLAPEIFAAARRGRAGQIDRSAVWYHRVLGLNGYERYEGLPPNWFIHDGDDGPDGLLAWKATGGDSLIPPLGTLEVWDMATATESAYRDFWAYLSGIDLVDEVKLRNRPVDEEVRWLLADGRSLVMTEQVDLTWLRLLDVPAALAARRYAAPGEVVLEVIDEDTGGPAAGRYRLAADGEDVECERTDKNADLEVTQRGLASIYLGGFTLGQLLVSGAAREHTPGTVARVDAMFSTPLAPWNATWF